jgi:hypothetical protein
MRHSSTARGGAADASCHRAALRAAPASRHAASKHSTFQLRLPGRYQVPGITGRDPRARPGPQVPRSRLTWLRRVVAAPAGGDPSHTASASASDETGTFADSSKLASTGPLARPRYRYRIPGTVARALHADATRIARRVPILAHRNTPGSRGQVWVSHLCSGKCEQSARSHQHCHELIRASALWLCLLDRGRESSRASRPPHIVSITIGTPSAEEQKCQ